MYHSKIPLLTKTKQQNKNKIIDHIRDKPLQRCRFLKRNIRLSLFIEANEKRQDAYIRYQCFFVALDILKKSDSGEKKNIDGKICYEIFGKAKNFELIKIHLREEYDEKNKICYFISCFYNKK